MLESMSDGAATVIAWLKLLHGADGPDPRLWKMFDDRLRLALAQGWVLHAVREPDDDLAEDLADDDCGGAHFARMLQDFVGRWRDVYVALPGEIGILNRTEVVGVDMELVVVTGPEHIGPVRKAAAVPGHSFVVRFEDDEWKIAALARRLPVPGWPPAERVVPGLEVDRSV